MNVNEVCQSKRHELLTCLDYSIRSKTFTFDKWCNNCQSKYRELGEHRGELDH